MATQIGIIKAVNGNVTATAADGSIRTLQAGDRVYANELISTGSAGAVEVEFADGSVMDLGRNSQALLDNAVFNPNSTDVAETEDQAVPDDVAAIQQAILEGEDPTEAGEATAAGAGVQGGNEGHDAVFVNYLNPEVTPEAGFDTIGVSNEIEEVEDEQLLEGTPTAGLVTVLLDEDDLGRNDEETSQAINDFLDGIQPEFLAATGLNLGDYPDAGVGDEDQPGDDLPSPTPTFFSGALNADFGFDGPGSISFNPVVSQPTGLTSGGEPVQIWVSADGLTLIGYIAGEGEYSPVSSRQQIDEGPQEGAEIIFSAQIDPVTLNFTAGIYGPLDHADTAEEGAFEENLLINMAFTITDSDGDSAQGIVQLNVDDDSPVIGEQDYPQEQGEYSDYPYEYEMAAVDEDDTDDGVGNTDSPGDDFSSSSMTLPINFGADGPAAENPVEISAEGIVDQFGNVLTSNGVEVQFSWNSTTNTLEGTADGQPVINIHVDVDDYGYGTDSEVNIELLDNLDHPEGAEGESLGTEDNLDITLNYTATDADGDQAYGSFDLSIDDDMPVIGTPEAVSVDEEGIDGNAGDSYDAGATVNGVLLMPELESGDLNSALDTDAKQAIKSFVEAGGQLVINGSSGSNDENLLNDIFGFSLTNGSNTSSNV
uniref:retention module-containing protein n=1 Tax=Methylophaga sp. TaxID=2024840 RepID=UPI003F69B9D0